jgi:hypothetical protein
MTKAADGRIPTFGGFGGDEVAEPTAFGKVALAVVVAVAIPMGGWLSLRPSPTEAAVTVDEGRTASAAERVAPEDDEGPTLADGETPEQNDAAGLPPTNVTRTEAATPAPDVKAPTPVEPERARTPARKRAPRPKTPPPADKPKQTSGMGPL